MVYGCGQGCPIAVKELPNKANFEGHILRKISIFSTIYQHFHRGNVYDFLDLFIKNTQISNGHISVNFDRMDSILV